MEEVETGLPRVTPISWATRASGVLTTAQVPLRADGSFETGDAPAQLRQVFANLRQAVAAAGAGMDDVLQVVVYLTDMADLAALNEAWVEVFAEPRPSRAVIGCATLAVPGIRVCVTAIASAPRE